METVPIHFYLQHLETPMSFRATEKILRTTRGSPFSPSRVPRHAPPLNKIWPAPVSQARAVVHDEVLTFGSWNFSIFPVECY